MRFHGPDRRDLPADLPGGGILVAGPCLVQAPETGAPDGVMRVSHHHLRPLIVELRNPDGETAAARQDAMINMSETVIAVPDRPDAHAWLYHELTAEGSDPARTGLTDILAGRATSLEERTQLHRRACGRDLPTPLALDLHGVDADAQRAMLAALAADELDGEAVAAVYRWAMDCECSPYRRAEHVAAAFASWHDYGGVLAPAPQHDEYAMAVTAPGNAARVLVAHRAGVYDCVTFRSDNGGLHELRSLSKGRPTVRQLPDVGHVADWVFELTRERRAARRGARLQGAAAMVAEVERCATGYLSPAAACSEIEIGELMQTVTRMRAGSIPSGGGLKVMGHGYRAGTQQAVRSRARDLNIRGAASAHIDDLLERIGAEAANRRPASDLVAGAGAFLIPAGSDPAPPADLEGLDVVESAAVHAIGGRFLHAGVPAVPGRLTRTVRAFDAVRPKSPFSAPGRA